MDNSKTEKWLAFQQFTKFNKFCFEALRTLNEIPLPLFNYLNLV